MEQYLSLDRALEQRCDDLALEQHEHDQSGYQDQDRAGAQQGDIGRVVALERSQRTGHRSLRRVLDQHQRKEKLVPRPDGHEDPERRDRRPREREVDAPEQIPGGRAVDAGRLRDLSRHVDEMGTHPEDGKGHVQADQRQHDRERCCKCPIARSRIVDRDDDPGEWERQPEHEQEQERRRAGNPQEADGESGHRRDDAAPPARPRGR